MPEKVTKDNSAGAWLASRYAVQAAAFLGFIALFLHSSQVLMALDPLVMLGSLISSRSLEPLALASIFAVALALGLGRAWCGWLCPMGTMLDWFSLNRFRSSKISMPEGLRSVKYIILIAILLASIFSNLLLIIFDPLTIMVRTFATAIWPALDFLVTSLQALLYRYPALSGIADTMDRLLRPGLLPTDSLSYPSGWVMGAILIGIILLNLLAGRFWCRYLCPLGAFYGLLSKAALVRREVKDSCITCKLCERSCPTGTIKRGSGCASDPGECIVCMNCLDSCPCSGNGFGRASAPARLNSYDPGKRQLFAGIGLAALAVAMSRFLPAGKQGSQSLIRPPGASADDMATRCIRCGECIKACPTAAIQPAAGPEAGHGTLFTPQLVMRNGFCQYSCNACGQACPVAAIPPLKLAEKKLTPIGRAYIDRGRCLPWNSNTPCIVCEEMCPVPQKAIVLSTQQVTAQDGSALTLQRPTVLTGRCVGCGLCEYKCPLAGEAAIRVYGLE